MGMREEFETWFRKNHYWAPESDPLVKDEAGEYYMLSTFGKWRAWQASRAALVIELPDCRCYDHPGEAYPAIQDCREAIEAAGVKVKI